MPNPSRDFPPNTDAAPGADAAFDVVIVGGGIAGLALARALQDAQLRVALLDPETDSGRSPAPGFDSRVYAISPANARFLRELGAWDRIGALHLTAVRGMCVLGDAPAAALEFEAYRSGESELAWIVEDNRLQRALRESLEGNSSFTRIGVPLRTLTFQAHAGRLALADGRTLDARLVVGADGARSPVREASGIASAAQAYGQRAVVANFACTRAHEGVAWQWFQGGPVLALLPLPGAHVSMVWSTGEDEARRLLALDAATLAREVADASQRVLGELALVTPQRAFDLQRLAARQLCAPRVALIGDAAHVIHPLAGQGANLGLQDARALAGVLAGREPLRDVGELRLLRRYERSRAEAILAMQATVHGLYRLFGARSAGAVRLRNAGLNLVDRLPVVKNLLMRHAMG